MIVGLDLLHHLQETPEFIPAAQLLKCWVGSYKGQDIFIMVEPGRRKRGRKKRKKRA